MTKSRTGTDRPRRRYAPRLPPEQRRAQLLDAAYAVLGRAELHELSMEAVAQQAGVAKPVLYTVFKTRAELVAALLERERERGLEQVADTLPTDLVGADPVLAASSTVAAFIGVVLEDPTRWRLILTSPGSAPEEYRAALRSSRTGIFDQAEALIRMGAALDSRWATIDSGLLANSLLTIAEMLGRLAVSEPAEYPRERLDEFVRSIVGLLSGGA
ncbi:TetR/AcrR family transcriptional regulator [Nocardia otitidiscaviarum]|uniref:Pyrimidine utilization regulatory protein R n=1 Tax=Nocardia otitidiscaviarum TaxID=1823 RepID=A0A378YU96_9NOCA|nr:TetR/AcrR family transcriptional regulator [Nocardia otitidiscaviarum]MBF6135124.1 TetR/AcrR family transcriptional regulator [Nocardia otitidiscaviarum]MBF6181233.1 TetR/AcrR family transcriptional regulator [Nocardia otitidiscaviarum]MBF6237100.1 TetR/AcrR family transcriptional regulator [Nocardia otitidiscaviarum]MBF6486946.1 TetR/AcrR family transcriptional regulator [Nocardia otitidiscaviarum]SUA80333.1 pyrimidine utilization regulatory protein R [Nocardia otitidiscaviarum]